MKKEALLYDKLPDSQVQCHTCQRRCTIPPGKRGWCLTRLNEGGVLYSLIYGEVSSLSINPIEKKPVFHFHPGTRWLSLGSLGCNFRCPGCQNWEIAHWSGKDTTATHYLSPEHQVEMALSHGCLGLSWTFNEPTLWFEYTLDSAKLAREKGLYTNYVTNGFITGEALDTIAPYLDVYRVDVKGFSADTYQKIAHTPDFEMVLKGAERAKRRGMHVEVVTNIIPGVNDDDVELKGIASWIKSNLDSDTPWHVTRFHPYLKLSHLYPTPVSTLEQAREIGMNAGLHYVYLGNVPGHDGENTYCHHCGSLLIKRYVFDVLENRIREGRCPECDTQIPGRF
jgi:pyruvate formate lyase activating enzyme